MRKKPKQKTSPNNSLQKATPVNDHTEVVAASFSASRQFSGPLPPPEILVRYNDGIPNGAERIMVMAEKQQDHRIYLEGFVITRDSKRADLGLVLGFVLALLLSGCGAWLIYLGKDITGFALIFAPLAALAGVFIQTQKVRKEEREARNKTITEQNSTKK